MAELELLRRPFPAEDEELTPCLRCGKSVRLKFNGGELDRAECCDLIYETRASGYVLIVRKKNG